MRLDYNKVLTDDDANQIVEMIGASIGWDWIKWKEIDGSNYFNPKSAIVNNCHNDTDPSKMFFVRSSSGDRNIEIELGDAYKDRDKHKFFHILITALLYTFTKESNPNVNHMLIAFAMKFRYMNKIHLHHKTRYCFPFRTDREHTHREFTITHMKNSDRFDIISYIHEQLKIVAQNWPEKHLFLIPIYKEENNNE